MVGQDRRFGRYVRWGRRLVRPCMWWGGDRLGYETDIHTLVIHMMIHVIGIHYFPFSYSLLSDLLVVRCVYLCSLGRKGMERERREGGRERGIEIERYSNRDREKRDIERDIGI